VDANANIVQSKVILEEHTGTGHDVPVQNVRMTATTVPEGDLVDISVD